MTPLPSSSPTTAGGARGTVRSRCVRTQRAEATGSTMWKPMRMAVIAWRYIVGWTSGRTNSTASAMSLGYCSDGSAGSVVDSPEMRTYGRKEHSGAEASSNSGSVEAVRAGWQPLGFGCGGADRSTT